ncbi:hypothetical protein NLJ89_g12086 [Agrocybe chaxingu]|uniref:MADF domain-containing protein n=1 Tax=Agrocybe chaxingu TaxID=84603 RepID=A0A9W8MPE6_9AGAR|nr:hypothetical protein NLJ89_g12086 [Agrocybe chaxingu]
MSQPRRRGAPKPQKVKIPELPWSENDHELVWKFITELEKDANYKILFGKKDPSEKNTSGDSRVSVFKRIAEALFPDLYIVDANTMGERMKGQLERLKKSYQKQAKRLRKTGEGVDGDEEREQMEYYIPAEGPNQSTPMEAVNLWRKTEIADEQW